MSSVDAYLQKPRNVYSPTALLCPWPSCIWLAHRLRKSLFLGGDTALIYVFGQNAQAFRCAGPPTEGQLKMKAISIPSTQCNPGDIETGTANWYDPEIDLGVAENCATPIDYALNIDPTVLTRPGHCSGLGGSRSLWLERASVAVFSVV